MSLAAEPLSRRGHEIAAGSDLRRPVPFDTALVRKYDVAGPRYTSYPTAPQFHAGFGAADFAGLAMVFDAYLAAPTPHAAPALPSPASGVRYSRTV